MSTYPYLELRAPYPNVITRIRLPYPDLGESESALSTMTTKRSLNGTLYTYIKTNENHQLLSFKFSMTRSKGEEFKRFLISYLSKQIYIMDHLDRAWAGYFITNPVEFTTIKRGSPEGGLDLVEVSIDFEGGEL